MVLRVINFPTPMLYKFNNDTSLYFFPYYGDGFCICLSVFEESLSKSFYLFIYFF